MKSKFSFWQVYFVFLFLLAFFILGCYYLVHPEIELKTKLGTKMSASIGGVSIICFACFFFYAVFKRVFYLKFENQVIYLNSLFSKKIIPESEIESINLVAIRSLGMLSGNADTSTITIILTSGEEIVLGDFFYKNSTELKLFIENEFRSKIISPIGNDSKRKSLGQLYYEETFKGNQFTSINGLIFYGMSILFIWIILDAKRIDWPWALSFFLLITGMFYLLLGKQMHYFLISGNKLIIKNHFWFWYKKEYTIDDILQVNFETPNKQSTALRITLKTYHSKIYSAGSLRDIHWALLKEKLKEMGLLFRD